MEKRGGTLRALIDYLMSHGYPPESLAIEYPSGCRRADLAVVDPETSELVAVFELKRERNPQSEKFGRQQLRSYLREVGNPAVPTYLVFDKVGSPPFEIVRIRLGSEEEAVPPAAVAPPDFGVLQHSRRSSVVAEKKREKRRALDAFLITCWICALACLVVLVFDVSTSFEMSEKQLVLFGSVVALILIPFARKLKILGVEFERLRKNSS